MKPAPSSPSRFAAGTRTPSSWSSPVAARVEPHLLLEPTDGEARRLGGHDERGDPRAAVVVRAGARGEDVQPGLARVGDEPLLAVDDPGAAVRARLVARRRPACRRRRSPPGSVRPYAPSICPDARGGRYRPVARPWRRWQRPAAEARVRRDDDPERAPDPADLLDGDRVRERIHPGAAPALRDVDPEPAQLADPAHDLGREAPRALVLVDDRRDLLGHERADGVPQQDVVGREIEVHGRMLPRPTDGSAARRTAVLVSLSRHVRARRHRAARDGRPRDHRCRRGARVRAPAGDPRPPAAHRSHAA